MWAMVVNAVRSKTDPESSIVEYKHNTGQNISKSQTTYYNLINSMNNRDYLNETRTA